MIWDVFNYFLVYVIFCFDGVVIKSYIFEVLMNKVYYVRWKFVLVVIFDCGNCNRKLDRRLFLDNILFFLFVINKYI